MEELIEAALEFVFSLFGVKHAEMPEVDYKDSFIIKYSTKRLVIQTCVISLFIVAFIVVFILMQDDTRFLFIIFSVCLLILLIINVINLLYRCMVNEEGFKISYCGRLSRYVSWQEVLCVLIKQKNERIEVDIEVLDCNGRCIFDFSSNMQNAWYAVKMAEDKGLEVRHESTNS